MAYRQIDQKLWDDKTYKGLPWRAQMLWHHLLSGPQATMLPGLQRTSVYQLADNLFTDGKKWKPSEVEGALEILLAAGMVAFDEEAKTLRLPNAPRFNPPTSGKTIRGWWNLWKAMPDCSLRTKHVQSLKAALPTVFAKEDWASPAWNATFGTLNAGFQTDSKSDSKSVDDPVPEDSVRAGDQEQEPEPEREQEQGPPPSAGAVAPALFALNPEESKPAKRRKKALRHIEQVDPSNPSVAKVWNRYRELISPTSKFDRDRDDLVLDRLKVYSADDLCRTIDGYHASPWHNGQNPDGKCYLDIEMMFRDAEKIEAGWKHLKEIPRNDAPVQPKPYLPFAERDAAWQAKHGVPFTIVMPS